MFRVLIDFVEKKQMEAETMAECWYNIQDLLKPVEKGV